MLCLRFTGRSTALAAPFLAVLFVGAFSAHADQDASWTVGEVSGAVFVKHQDGESTPVSAGDEIPLGSTIDTPEDGRAVLTRGETSMTVAPNSEVTVAKDDGDGALTTIFQKLGSVLYKVEKQSDQHFEVETPFLAAVVKGTSFTVGVNDRSAVTHVVEGAVEVTSLGSRQSQMVRPGQTVTVSSANGLQIEMSHLRGGTQETAATDVANDPATTADGQTTEKKVVDRTLGVTEIDITEVTDGLASSSTTTNQTKAGRDSGDEPLTQESTKGIETVRIDDVISSQKPRLSVDGVMDTGKTKTGTISTETKTIIAPSSVQRYASPDKNLCVVTTQNKNGTVTTTGGAC